MLRLAPVVSLCCFNPYLQIIKQRACDLLLDECGEERILHDNDFARLPVCMEVSVVSLFQLQSSKNSYRWNTSLKRRCTRALTSRLASLLFPLAPVTLDRSKSHSSDGVVRSLNAGVDDQNTARGSGSPEKPTFHTLDPGLWSGRT